MRRFATTRWSLVQRAGQRTTRESREALETLCRLYWPPLYAFVRRSGKSADDAADLTQAFFARLIDKGDLAAAREDRGRFRSWLLACMKNFMNGDRAWHQAQKRWAYLVSIDAESESHYAAEPPGLDPESLYHRKWAMTVAAQAIEQLEAEYSDKREEFELLKDTLMGDALPYEQIGAALGIKANAVKQRVRRFRLRFFQLVKDSVGDTIESPDRGWEVDDEHRQLIAAARTSPEEIQAPAGAAAVTGRP